MITLDDLDFIVQPILVYMSKVDGKFNFSPISVNFLTEAAKVVFAIVMLLIQVTLCIYVYLLQFHFICVNSDYRFYN